MPSFLSAAMTRVLGSGAAARAAFTVGFVTLTPRRRSAMSGLTTTLPVPLTLIVCSGGLVGSTALIGRGAKAVLAMAATRRPTASQRVRAPGMAMVMVEGIGGLRGLAGRPILAAVLAHRRRCPGVGFLVVRRATRRSRWSPRYGRKRPRAG